MVYHCAFAGFLLTIGKKSSSKADTISENDD